ncbi:MAG: hypothetical protein A3C06_00115 [Candidatus Taylorbacteria bacterium RIFCSPHIGHO2_02_FULL_46_13]|uniref:Uncharacterized protein n=1 Tax=Candidatus Taylorbacteria bacterium RIFCSPHIGHO2_02_FULL_46_13 TaxID=1802312 RepID=A0A1G2MS57_9BACT|nr:MAG: hypothetical protein A3C06_00115 [Candidatus Taylorbacteria bacterium RIFCSPHIGHO2_02_FULL_46_13]
MSTFAHTKQKGFIQPAECLSACRGDKRGFRERGRGNGSFHACPPKFSEKNLRGEEESSSPYATTENVENQEVLKMNPPHLSERGGFMLIGLLVFASIAIVIITAFVALASSTLLLARYVAERELAIQIAEAGVDYYRWHLAHNPSDYEDGTGVSGPYTHEFYNKTGEHIGDFILTITPPSTGSTIVTVESEGRIATTSIGSGISRTVRTRLAIPSFAKYAVVANDVMRFGEGTEIFGPVHSNNGVRFDGLAHNLVSSSRTSYDDPDHSGGNEFGVHTHASPTDPLPPSTPPIRAGVFEAGRVFPVPAVDFAGITSDLANMKDDAQIAGRYFAPSGDDGYHLVFAVNDTFSVYRVNNLRNPPGGCSSSGQSGWGTWSIANGGETFLGAYPIPANGVIFVEDNIWVNGQINTARITVASGKFPDNPSTRTSITVNTDLLYTNYDGTDAIGLIAQQDVNVGLYSEDNLRIDAALIAQNGRVGRYYYENDCGLNHVRDEITLYGMIGTSKRYGFAYTDGTGYQDRFITYDSNLLYGPPPSFPLTSDQYQTISWEEL